MPNKSAIRRPDAAIARIATSQHGVVTRAQLVEAGLLPSGISDRLTAGRLHRLHRGVYAVGHPKVSNEGRWMGAVLACGNDAALSHQSAAQLWGMLRGRPSLQDLGADGPPIHVTIPGHRGRKRRRGIRIHRSITLSPADVTRRAGIPVTNPARTITDLRRMLPSKQFARALREAEYLGLPVGTNIEPDRTRSELEASFLALVRRHRLPTPEVNARVDNYVVDFLWPANRLIVEVDGWQSHGTRSAFEQDRVRDACLKVLGYEVLRFTWRRLESDPLNVSKTIRQLLGR
jgi:very-short-patch-repair endonuclease